MPQGSPESLARRVQACRDTGDKEGANQLLFELQRQGFNARERQELVEGKSVEDVLHGKQTDYPSTVY